MATVYELLTPEDSRAPDSNAATVRRVGGANAATVLAFSDTTAQSARWLLAVPNYGSGNLTVKVRWTGDTATTGGVVWGATLAATTPGDAEVLYTATAGAQATATTTHGGTNAQRLHETTITVTGLDSLAAGDVAMLEIQRLTADASDTMASPALLVDVLVSYSDT